MTRDVRGPRKPVPTDRRPGRSRVTHWGDSLLDTQPVACPGRPRESPMSTRISARRSPARAALRYAQRGWKVLPLHSPTRAGCSCGDRDCLRPGKHPRTARGVHDASHRPEQVLEWWSRWPQANVGIVTGALVVIDVEGAQGHSALTGLQERLDRGLPPTAWVDTARGRHLYF